MNTVFKWFNDRLPIVNTFERHLSKHPVPKKVNFWYLFGALASVVLIIQIISGIWLMMPYQNTEEGAFSSIEFIMRDVDYGWVIRYMHTTGASMFFAVVYLHMFRGLLYGSYKKPRELVWIFGMTIYLVMMAEGFLGYVLPYGQMSYWGATVITNLFSAIPIIGEGLKTWLLGDYNVGNATLNRFFALHYVLPFVIFGVVGLHVAAVHVHGSNNPDGIDIKTNNDSVNFFPYMLIKDTVAMCAFGVAISAVIFFGPNLMAEVDNYIPADPLVTPAHIVPNWYLAPFYAILRAVPDKLGGVLLMFGAIVILFVLPWLDRSKVRSCNYRPIYKWFMMGFFVNFFALGYVGMLPAEGLYLLIARVGLLYYFGFFFIITPFVGWIEKPSKLPLSISDVYAKNIAPNIGGGEKGIPSPAMQKDTNL